MDVILDSRPIILTKVEEVRYITMDRVDRYIVMERAPERVIELAHRSGLQGVQGIQGIQGVQGIQGLKGDKGDQGDQGIQGIQGLKGDQGIQGPIGLKGDKGDQGDQGIQGPIGLTGADSVVPGPIGPQGPQGPIGLKGDTGNTGAQGLQGIQGLQGLKGDTGAQGIQGIQGERGDDLVTVSGADYILPNASIIWNSLNFDPQSLATSVHTHDASDITTGVFDIDRIPVLPSQLQFTSSGDLTALTAPQQAAIGQGSIVTVQDGTRYVYTGTGSKTAAGSYIVLADVTPDWTTIFGKPATYASTIPLVSGLQDALNVKANLASPAFTGLISITGPRPNVKFDDNSYSVGSSLGLYEFEVNGGLCIRRNTSTNRDFSTFVEDFQISTAGVCNFTQTPTVSGGGAIWHPGNFDPGLKFDKAGGTITGNVTMDKATPILAFQDTNAAGALGKFRMYSAANNFYFTRNTHATTPWASESTIFSVPSGTGVINFAVAPLIGGATILHSSNYSTYAVPQSDVSAAAAANSVAKRDASGNLLVRDLFASRTATTGLIGFGNAASPYYLHCDGAMFEFRNLTVLKMHGNTVWHEGNFTPANYIAIAGDSQNINTGKFYFGNGRALSIGYSGGNYGGIGYNINYTNTADVHTAPVADSASLLDFPSGGFRILGSAAGAAGRTVTWTTLLTGGLTGDLLYRGATVYTSANFNPTGAQTFASVNTVSVTAKNGATGYLVMQPGTATHSGYLEIYEASGVRQGYIGYSAAGAPIGMNGNYVFNGTVTGLTKTTVGLANVDNTADSAKPVSTAQQTALNLKANAAAAEFTGVTRFGAGRVQITNDSPFVTGGNIYTNGYNFGIGTSSAHSVTFYTNNTLRLTLDSAGGATFAGNVTMPSWTVTSDERLKKNIEQLPDMSSVFDGAQVKSFDKQGVEGRQIGVIAQEFREIAPELVRETETIHEDGTPILAVDGNSLMFLMLAEIKDLRRRLAEAGL